jgi:hypothetical protein
MQNAQPGHHRQAHRPGQEGQVNDQAGHHEAGPTPDTPGAGGRAVVLPSRTEDPLPAPLEQMEDPHRLSRLLRRRTNEPANETAFRNHAYDYSLGGGIPGFRLLDDEERLGADCGLDPRDCADRLLAEWEATRASH